MAAGEHVGEAEHPDHAEQALQAAEEQEDRPDQIGGLGPGVHRWSSVPSARTEGRSRTAMNLAMPTEPVKPRKASTSITGK